MLRNPARLLIGSVGPQNDVMLRGRMASAAH